MAKLRLDGTSKPSPYADWTSNYRTSQMIEDRRGPEFEKDRDEASIELFLNSKEFKDKMSKIPDRLPEKFDKLPPQMEDYIENSKKK